MKRIVLVALGTACGNDLHHTVDAPPADMTGDTLATSTDDGPPGAVKLTVMRGTTKVSNVAVYFQDPSSTLIEQKLTNENGIAWALMPSGGFVSAIEHVGGGLEEISTFAAVAPADLLRLDFMNPGQTKEWRIQLSFAADAAGAAYYTVRTSCNADAFSVTQPAPASAGENTGTLSGCDDGVADFVIQSFDVEGNSTGRALYAGTVPLPTAGTPGAFAALALPGDFANMEPHTIDYVNVPDTLSAIGVLQGISATRRAYEVTTSGERTSSTISLAVNMPSGSATQITSMTGFPAATTEIGQQLVYDWGASTAAYSLDVAAASLPRYLTAPAYDPAARTITWTEAAASAQPNVVRARIHVHRDDIPTGRSWGWRIIAPRSTTASVAYPQLPIVDFDFNPKDGDTVGVDELTNAQLPAGYAAWRQTGFVDIAKAISGSSGRIAIETLYVPEL